MAGYVGVAPGSTTIQTEDGRVLQLVDWIDSWHWGTCEWQDGDTADISVFSAAGSQPVPGGNRNMTKVDTNIPRQGDNGLPQSMEFYVYSIANQGMRATRTSGSNTNPLLTDYSDPLSQQTLFNLDRRLFAEYKYNAKSYSQGLPRDYPGGGGIYWQGTQTARESVSLGPPSVRERVAMVLPIWEREGLGYVLNLSPQIALSISQPALDAPTDTTKNLNFVDHRWMKVGLIKRQVN
jgi:hypothetical protein